MRFGNFNHELFKAGHEAIMMESRAKSSWEVKFDNAGFYSQTVWKGWHALIDPGYPFIALPKQAFTGASRLRLRAETRRGGGPRDGDARLGVVVVAQ